MRKWFGSLVAALILLALVPIGRAHADNGPVGIWRLSSGKVTVRVFYCGGANLCANIVALSQPLTKAGKPKTDHENPNRSLRGRRVIGLQVVSGMVPSGENRWKGRIYNADDGGTYSARMRLSGNSMLIEGCWGPFCKKNRFIRVQ
jgi:uncharacterized protein (DUF2147 family)